MLIPDSPIPYNPVQSAAADFQQCTSHLGWALSHPLVLSFGNHLMDVLVITFLALVIILSCRANNFQMWDFAKVVDKIKMPAQRIALVSLCVSSLLLLLQIAFYLYWHWSKVGDYILFCNIGAGFCGGNCAEYVGLPSAPAWAVYLSTIWMALSFVCVFWWGHITHIKCMICNWIENGSLS